MTALHDFVVVANRLPVDFDEATGTWTPSPGGLVSALSPVLAHHRGCWVGWPGVVDEHVEPMSTDAGTVLHPVPLSATDYEEFYEGFSNATLWPLYHDLIVTPAYHRTWWATYRDVNLRFATEVSQVAAPGATVWVQDYQLQLLPSILRQLRPDLRIGFFLHIPFPSPDIFRQLPWRDEMIRGVLGADIIGFHLESNVANFLALARRQGYEVTGIPATRRIGAHIQDTDGRSVGIGAFPISLQLRSEGAAEAADLATQLRADLGNPELLLLGVDRLDYTKGIGQRLLALEELLETGALDPARTTFVQIATPSRERIDSYRQVRSQVEEIVGRINGRFGSLAHPVVHYLHRSIPSDQLQAYYRAADIMVVTPFKDGMNLVAKEYIACHGDGSGALVLSEFAGAADELTQAYLCNPFDIESVKRAIHIAATALGAGDDNPSQRMSAMYQHVATHDVHLWSQAFLTALGASIPAPPEGAEQ